MGRPKEEDSDSNETGDQRRHTACRPDHPVEVIGDPFAPHDTVQSWRHLKFDKRAAAQDRDQAVPHDLVHDDAE